MTTTARRAQAVPNVTSDPAPFLWTRAQYEKAIIKEVFTTQDRIELIEGEIVQKLPQKQAHQTAIGAMQEVLGNAFPQGHWVRIQMPLAIGSRSMPEPDFAVVPGSWRDYRGHVPTPEQVILLVEISDATLRFDQGRKAKLYAGAGIPEYWIVNLIECVLEVRRAPQPDGYDEMQRLAAGEAIVPLASQAASIAVADLLP